MTRVKDGSTRQRPAENINIVKRAKNESTEWNALTPLNLLQNLNLRGIRFPSNSRILIECISYGCILIFRRDASSAKTGWF